MSKKTTARKWGDYQDERCSNCGKFAQSDDAFFDRKDRSDDCSPILRFCNEGCADKFAAFRDDTARRVGTAVAGLVAALR